MERANVVGNKPAYFFTGPLSDAELLTVSQTEIALNCGKTSVFELVNQGRLERVRIPGVKATRITRRSVESLITEGLEPVEPEMTKASKSPAGRARQYAQNTPITTKALKRCPEDRDSTLAKLPSISRLSTGSDA
jgi:hypothetical protein